MGFGVLDFGKQGFGWSLVGMEMGSDGYGTQGK